MIDLAEFKRKAEQATPGSLESLLPQLQLVLSEQTDADRDFVAACSREVILELIARVEAAEKLIAQSATMDDKLDAAHILKRCEFCGAVGSWDRICSECGE